MAKTHWIRRTEMSKSLQENCQTAPHAPEAARVGRSHLEVCTLPCLHLPTPRMAESQGSGFMAKTVFGRLDSKTRLLLFSCPSLSTFFPS